MRQKTLRTSKELGDFLVPKGDVAFAIIEDGSESLVAAEVGHEAFHAANASDEVEDAWLGRLLVESANGVVDGLSKDGRETMAHGGVSKGIFVVAPVCGPRRVVGGRP